MIIFNGWKSLTAIPALLIGFLVGGIVGRTASFGLIFAGVTIAALGFYLNRVQQREDPATGQLLEYKERNGFFWIPVQYWGILIGVLGVVVSVGAKGY